MVRRLGVFGSASALLASAFVALATIGGASAAHAASFEDWASVSAGDQHTCGVRSNGKLYCWGINDYGQLGDGEGPSLETSPRRIGGFEDWATVSAGDFHTCAIRHGGRLYCWGWDENGQVGDGAGDDDAITTPKRIGTFEDWVNVAGGGSHTCGVRANGKLYCWGNDGHGQVGDGDGNLYANVPKRIGTFEDWANVNAGYQSTCGVRTKGKLYCWGSDSHGQVGDGGDQDNFTPVNAPERIGTFEDWAKASAGEYHSCGVRKNGKLYCWGRDASGEVGEGDGASIPVLSPRRIGTFEDWADVSAGGGLTCGVRTSGKLYCWGFDGSGQVGDGGETPNLVPITSPKRIGAFEDWSTATAGRNHAGGVRKNGKLYCWGYDGDGEVGDGEEALEPATSPRRI